MGTNASICQHLRPRDLSAGIIVAMADTTPVIPDRTLDARGTLCPIPIVWTAERIKSMNVGQILEVLATDEAIQDDLPAWARATRHEFLGFQNEPPLYRGYVRRAHE